MTKITPLLFLMVLFYGYKTEKHPIEDLQLEQVKNQIQLSETQEILFTLAADSMKGRDTKSKGYYKAATFVRSYFKSNKIAAFYPEYKDSLSTKGRNTYNVVGRLGSYDPNKKTILIGAHLDHIGIRGSVGDSIYNGANDNASGATAVLQIGKFLAQFEWDQNIILALFADEEQGLRGAYHLAKRFKKEGVSIDYMVNFEMIGTTLTTGANQVYMTGYNYSNMPELMNQKSPNFVQYLPEAKELNLFRRSDNYAFFKESNTPAFTLSSFDFKNFDYYHKAGDEAELLHTENMNRIICTAAFTLAKMIHKQDRVQFQLQTQQQPSMEAQ